MIRIKHAAFMLLSCCIASDYASAHARSESYSHWHITETAMTGTITTPLREVMTLYQVEDSEISPKQLLLEHLIENVSVQSDTFECPIDSSGLLTSPPDYVRVEFSFDCQSKQPNTIHFRAMFEAAPAHVNYAKLHKDGMLLGEFLFTNTKDIWNFSSLESIESYSLFSFLLIGIEHISGGIDHIAFLLGLLLIAGSLGRSIIAVTGFTIGHSISLAAAVLGYLHADGTMVEAFIGFTVALVAVEYFLLRQSDVARLAFTCLAIACLTGLTAFGLDLITERSLFAYFGIGLFANCYLLAANQLKGTKGSGATLLLLIATCCFGLVHGFGFAGFLMETGLLGTSLIIPLLGFNLGVEVGQLGLVLIALVVSKLLKNRLPHFVPQAAAASLCGVGVFWFLSRTIA